MLDASFVSVLIYLHIFLFLVSRNSCSLRNCKTLVVKKICYSAVSYVMTLPAAHFYAVFLGKFHFFYFSLHPFTQCVWISERLTGPWRVKGTEDFAFFFPYFFQFTKQSHGQWGEDVFSFGTRFSRLYLCKASTSFFFDAFPRLTPCVFDSSCTVKLERKATSW